jgi:hypothetical protein
MTLYAVQVTGLAGGERHRHRLAVEAEDALDAKRAAWRHVDDLGQTPCPSLTVCVPAKDLRPDQRDALTPIACAEPDPGP